MILHVAVGVHFSLCSLRRNKQSPACKILKQRDDMIGNPTKPPPPPFYLNIPLVNKRGNQEACNVHHSWIERARYAYVVIYFTFNGIYWALVLQERDRLGQ